MSSRRETRSTMEGVRFVEHLSRRVTSRSRRGQIRRAFEMDDVSEARMNIPFTNNNDDDDESVFSLVIAESLASAWQTPLPLAAPGSLLLLSSFVALGSQSCSTRKKKRRRQHYPAPKPAKLARCEALCSANTSQRPSAALHRQARSTHRLDRAAQDRPT